MALIPPSKNWWKVPLGKDEKIWAIAIIIMIVMMGTMTVTWVFMGNQNPPELYRKISYEDYKAEAFSNSELDQGTVTLNDGTSVDALIADETDTDIYLGARTFEWVIYARVNGQDTQLRSNGDEPKALQVKANTYYRLHVYGEDRLHGFEISELVFNIQVVYQYDYVFEFMATQPGLYQIICNEYCGVGHHTMVLWLEVVE